VEIEKKKKRSKIIGLDGKMDDLTEAIYRDWSFVMIGGLPKFVKGERNRQQRREKRRKKKRLKWITKKQVGNGTFYNRGGEEYRKRVRNASWSYIPVWPTRPTRGWFGFSVLFFHFIFRGIFLHKVTENETLVLMEWGHFPNMGNSLYKQVITTLT
jgi:hypothetical protein